MTRDTDITKKGSMSYKQLQDANNDPFASVRPQPISLYNVHAHADQDVSSSLAGTATPWGESMFDEGVATEEQFQHLGDVRAENQPWFAKIGAGLAKGAVLAGTTFLDGTLGLLFGGGTAWAEDRWSGLWDNEFSKAMQNINQWAEEALPNYYTEAEQEGPWYNNIFTANFLGDKFIKNLGFTIGAFYSGGVTAAGLKATKLPQLIGAITKSSKAPAMINTAVGAVVSAVNEGRIEALNNSDDWFKYNKAQLDDAYNQRLLELQEEFMATSGSQLINNGDGSYTDPAYMKFQQAVQKEKEAYNAALGKLSEDRLKMGNADLLMNIPILTASNIIQFGKLYANGFQTARRTSNIVGRAGQWSAGTTKLGTAASITKSSLSEGLEEISQKAASVISGDYYSTDVNNFYKSKTDPDAEQETLSWTKSFAKGINETVNDASSWEEFFIGSLTGALGIPRFRGIRNDQGQLQSPITFEQGALNQWRDYREKSSEGARDCQLYEQQSKFS